MYEDYGGQSINLIQFWEAKASGKSIEEAALSTFTGSRMKAKGFGKFTIWSNKRILCRL